MKFFKFEHHIKQRIEQSLNHNIDMEWDQLVYNKHSRYNITFNKIQFLLFLYFYFIIGIAL